MRFEGVRAPVSQSVSPQAFLTGGGKIAGIISEFDWSKTPLGAIEAWPASLKTTVGLILRSPVAIVTRWGDQGTMIYNDAYSEFAAARHPRLLGSAVRDGWPEVADFNDNIMKVVLGRGEMISYRDFELVLYRREVRESVWFNLDYSPVLDENGERIGVIAIVVEITEAHHATLRLRENEARLRFLDALAKETAKSSDADTILAVTTRMVGEHMGVSICAYADMDCDQDGFTIRGDWSALGSPTIVGHYSLADFGELAVKNLRSGLPLVINDNLKELPPAAAATFQAIGGRSGRGGWRRKPPHDPESSDRHAFVRLLNAAGEGRPRPCRRHGAGSRGHDRARSRRAGAVAIAEGGNYRQPDRRRRS